VSPWLRPGFMTNFTKEDLPTFLKRFLDDVRGRNWNSPA